jgi:hypothetical protein
MYTMMGEVKGILETVQEQTAENTRTLRGHNGTDGLVTKFARMETTISTLDKKIETVNNSIQDIPAVISEWRCYPSLTWMVRHKLKEMTLITAGVIILTIFIGFPGQYVGERVQIMIEYLFAKWLGI